MVVPVVVEWMQSRGRELAWDVVRRLFTIAIVVLSGIALLGIVLAPWIVDNSLNGSLTRLRAPAVPFRDRYFGTDADYGLDSLAASPATLVLYPSGVAAGPITVGLGLNGYSRQVKMTRGGQIRILP